MKRSLLYIFLLGSLCLQNCTKPVASSCENSNLKVLENKQFGKENKPDVYTNKIFILNEGTFKYGNASISAYNSSSKAVENNIFKNTNQFALGDVVQDIKRKDGFLYLVVNNSQKIEIVKESSFERLKTISGLPSPRYLEFTADNEMLVSDLYEQKITTLDLNKACQVASIKTKGWTEQIFKLNNYFWIIERNGIGVEEKFANLLKIDASNFSIEKRIPIAVEPNSALVDNEQNIWILSSGEEAKNTLPELLKINTSTSNVEKRLSFNDFLEIPQNLAFNANKNTLYFSKGKNIYQLNTTDNQLPSTSYFTSNANIIYNIAIHPSSEDFYISDAKDYISEGVVYRYNSSGNLVDEINVGVIPSKILF